MATVPDPPTIFDLASEVPKLSASGKASPHWKPVTDGMEPTPIDHITKEGLYELEPDEILTIHVETVAEDANGNVVGFQRPLNTTHARVIARAIESGRKLAPPTVALDHGKFYAPEGQHRLVAAVIAGKSIKVMVEKLDRQERIDRFADQVLGKKPSSDVLILGRAETDPVAAYIRAAIEAEHRGEAHPLAGWVGIKADPLRIGITTMYAFLGPYAINRVTSASEATRVIDQMTPAQRAKITPELLDEALSLYLIYGPKKHAHKLAYAPATTRAMADLAIHVVLRADQDGGTTPKEAAQRWRRLMAGFNFYKVPSDLTRHRDIRRLLAKKWNASKPERFVLADSQLSPDKGK